MLENLKNFFKRIGKKEEDELLPSSSDAAKERLHLVLMQDRVNVSVDFLDMMKQEIIEVIKKYIDIDEKIMDVRLTNLINEDGTNGAPALYANIPIIGIKADKKINLNENIDAENEKKDEIKISNNEQNKETVNSTKKTASNKNQDVHTKSKSTQGSNSNVEKNAKTTTANKVTNSTKKTATKKSVDKTGNVEDNNVELKQ